jgi:hypothetical protein
MTTAVSGLVKIGRTQKDQYLKRMQILENNGYSNVTGLKKFFAIEVKDYEDKEKLLHEIFAKSRVGESELFALDFELLQQLLLAFEGKVVFPPGVDKEKQFDNVTVARKEDAKFSFYKKGLKNNDEVTFTHDKNVKAYVAGENVVSYGDQLWKLSPLTRQLFIQQGKSNKSGAYQGSNYFEYKGIKLKNLPNCL